MRFGKKTIMLAAVVVAAACGGSSDTTGPTTSGNTGGNTGTPTPPATTPTATNAVTVSDDQFTPANIQVSPGTTVTWTWSSGSTTHNVTFSDGTASGDKPAGSTFTRTFSTTGTFNYQCTIHPGMTGSVLVK